MIPPELLYEIYKCFSVENYSKMMRIEKKIPSLEWLINSFRDVLEANFIFKFIKQTKRWNRYRAYCIIKQFEYGIRYISLKDPMWNEGLILKIAVMGGYNHIVKQLLADHRVSITNFMYKAILFQAAQDQHRVIVDLLLHTDRIDPVATLNSDGRCYHITGSYSSCLYGTLYEAAKSIEIFKLFLSIDELKFRKCMDGALNTAIIRNDIDLIKLILQDKRVVIVSGSTIKFALQCNCVNIALLLLSDTKNYSAHAGEEALITACNNGKMEVVELLLQDDRINPAYNDNRAIRDAATNGHFEIAQLLITHSSVINDIMLKMVTVLYQEDEEDSSSSE